MLVPDGWTAFGLIFDGIAILMAARVLVARAGREARPLVRVPSAR